MKNILLTLLLLFPGTLLVSQVIVDENQDVGIGVEDPSEKLEVDGNLNVDAIIHETDGVGPDKSIEIRSPKGGNYRIRQQTGLFGFIKIKLPAYNKNTMITIKGSVYNYADNRSFEFSISGYDQAGNSMIPGYWSRAESHIVSNSPRNDFPIRVLLENESKYIAIGEEDTEWSHVNVTIDKVICTHSNAVPDIWKEGWEISIDNTMDGTQLYENLVPSPYAVQYRTMNGSNGGSAVFYPEALYTGEPSETGFIRISIPHEGNVAVAMKKFISVYNNFDKTSFECIVSGRIVSNVYENSTSYLFSENPNINHPIRITTTLNGDHFVYIGESNSTWTRPSVTVSRIENSLGTAQSKNYVKGWEIDIVPNMEGTLRHENLSPRFKSDPEIGDFLRLIPRVNNPSNPEIGTVYYHSGENELRVFTNTGWETLSYD